MSSMLCALTTSLAFSEEAESPFSFTAATDFYSDYMFRGFNLYEGLSIQPSLEGSYSREEVGTFTFNVWSHLSADLDNSTDRFTEVDYTLSYSKDVGSVTGTVGFARYSYPRRNSAEVLNTGEAFASIAWNTLLTPTVSVFSDVDAYSAEYYELGFSHEFEVPALGDTTKMSPFVAFGFASQSEKVYERNGLEQITYGVSFPMQTGILDVAPSFNMTHGIDDYTTTNFWFGISFAYAS